MRLRLRLVLGSGLEIKTVYLLKNKEDIHLRVTYGVSLPLPNAVISSMFWSEGKN
jgi:hypothetical protein